MDFCMSKGIWSGNKSLLNQIFYVALVYIALIWSPFSHYPKKLSVNQSYIIVSEILYNYTEAAVQRCY